MIRKEVKLTTGNQPGNKCCEVVELESENTEDAMLGYAPQVSC